MEVGSVTGDVVLSEKWQSGGRECNTRCCVVREVAKWR